MVNNKGIKLVESKVSDTRGSFDFQWKNIPEGAYLLSDPVFRENIDNFLVDELGLSRDFLKGLFVVDAGCGNGRWTYGLLKLGCKVVAFDFTVSGCRETKKNTRQFDDINVVLADILHVPFRQNLFDMAFCWGVLHHTGNMELAFKNVASIVRCGGLLHVYVYGPKSVRIKMWRKILSPFSYNGKLIIIKILTQLTNRLPLFRVFIPFSTSIHGTFDAYSPSINVESSKEYIFSLFKKNGFRSIKRLNPKWCNAAFSLDIHMQGEKK
ncbi:MAG: methyltransferase domain-containing protein [Candidatus Bathyarchaeia archaeon]